MWRPLVEWRYPLFMGWRDFECLIKIKPQTENRMDQCGFNPI